MHSGVAGTHARRLAVAVAVFAAAAAVTGFMPAAVSASCGSDCHGVTRWFPAPENTAEIAYLTTSSLSGITDYCAQTGYSTTWEGTNNDADFNTWVEEGIHRGLHYNGSCSNQGLQFYWADQRPGLGYAEHYPGGTVDLGTRYAFKIEYFGGATDEWDVYRDGTLINDSTSNPCCSLGMQAGAEGHSVGSSFIEGGEADGFQKEIVGNWSYHWGGAAVFNPEHYFTMSGTPSGDEYYSH